MKDKREAVKREMDKILGNYERRMGVREAEAKRAREGGKVLKGNSERRMGGRGTLSHVPLNRKCNVAMFTRKKYMFTREKNLLQKK